MAFRYFIRGRQAWGAAAPLRRTHDDWTRPVTLVIHHTAGSRPATMLAEHQQLRSFQRGHFANGWSDIGYNYLIGKTGRIYEGRGWGVVGAHTANHNTGTIGVSIMDNLDIRRPTIRQRIALVWLARHLRKKGARIVKVRGHREMPGQSTACPGRHGMRLVRVTRKALGLGA